MTKLEKILTNEKVERFVKDGKGEYLNWGEKRKEIVYIQNKIYWKHTESHYKYIGVKN